jgi:magnesium transporter
MLMGTGGNCGAQASTLAIRGLSLGEIELKDIWRVLWKELRVGLMLGIALAVANFARMWFLTPDARSVAMIVSIAVFFTVVIAKAIGCTLPLIAKAIHLDPALMASPIITTVVDATSLAVLFLIATRIFSLG